jgi:hypothetical protein
MAAGPAISSTVAITPERTRFIKASLEAAFVCSRYFLAAIMPHAVHCGTPRAGCGSCAVARRIFRKAE